MTLWERYYLALVVAGFVVFAVVLAAQSARQAAADRRRMAADGPAVATGEVTTRT